ncbi:tetratricopeptide repeat protein [Methanococcus maripaludis]|uniref:Tetratricopeptide (TPR) repeat protein n=1 Tax=Methanococcus maripaludis TaxID=39152 RepID=A0A7J9S8S9_METMI|nr:tetratricopeptide repeat protein [Methanococcus maripaludis]MBB6495986.1 tetratricopeptide (TPR) repeat protein [Methanococcus maripaludis]
MSKFKELMDEGTSHCKNERYDEAIECFNKAIPINPYDDKLFSVIGRTYYKKEDYAKATEYYERSIEINPNCHYSRYNWLGNCYYYLKDHSKALNQYKKVVKINPNYYTAYYNMGNSYLGLKKYTEAIKCYDLAINLNPDYIYSYYDKGAALYKNGDDLKALECFEHFLKYESDDNALDFKGQLLYRLGRKDDAMEIFNLVKDVELGNTGIGMILYAKKDYAGALDAYRQAFDVCQRMYIAESIITCAKQCNLKNALEIFNKYPKNPIAKYAVGLVNIEMDEYHNAIKSFKSILELNEDSIEFNSEFFTIFKYVYNNIDEKDSEYTSSILKNLYPVLKEVMDFKDKRISKNSSNLVHYTTPDAIRNLIKKDSHFRLSNVKYMNDPEEGEILLKNLKGNKIKEIAEKKGLDRYDDKKIDFGNEYPLQCFYDEIDGIDFQTTFIGSFLKQDDNLYLWRTYGRDSKKEEGKGMCVSISSKFFDKKPQITFDSLSSKDSGVNINKNNEDMGFSPVIYDIIYDSEESIEKIIIPFLKDIEGYLHKLKDLSLEQNGKYKALISTAVRAIMDEILYLVKSKNYQEEKESRILVTCGINHPKIKYNEDMGFPYKLYIEIEKPFREYIEKIVLGPCIEDCGRWKLYLNREGIKVKESNCKYR